MAGLDSLKDIVRPPFANYDIVVYFGCGLFLLPLIVHYFTEPVGFRLPRFAFHIGNSLAETLISTLSLLFSVYVLGHIIAYVSSILIEKSIDAFFGKVSSAILLSKFVRDGRQEPVRAFMFDRFKKAFSKSRWSQNLIRISFHIPALPFYLFVFVLGSFDYYKSRIPAPIMARARALCRANKYGLMRLDSSWYKSIEYDVINNCSSAVPRMYNYLVISGVFRSLSLLFLLSLWCEYIYIILRLLGLPIRINPLMSDHDTSLAHAFAVCMLTLVYGFCVSSYMKFQRRYAEEAIFAFALTR